MSGHEQASSLMRALCALIRCHELNMILRNVKDSNVFVSENGTFKLGDFSVSKILGDASSAVTLKGTPTYIAPGVYLDGQKYYEMVDFYSLGIGWREDTLITNKVLSVMMRADEIKLVEQGLAPLVTGFLASLESKRVIKFSKSPPRAVYFFQKNRVKHLTNRYILVYSP